MSTAAQPEQAVVREDDGLNRHISRLGLLFTGVGSIIGSGWLFGALEASQIAGPAAIVSWLLGGLMILFIALTFAELGTMFPLSGGVIRYPHFAFGSFASFIMGWINWVAAASVAPVEVEAALQYASNYIDGLTRVTEASGGNPVLTFPLGYGVAVLLMALFTWINFVGVGLFARINTIIVWWKLGVILLVIVAFLLTALHPGNLHEAGGFAPNGTHGIFEAIATAGITFSFLGFRQGIELAGESDDPKRNVPFAVIGSVLITAAIYVLLQVAFILALPERSLADGWGALAFDNDFGPLAGLASIIGLSWLAGILYADAVVSPGDTGLIYATVTARLSYAMAQNGNAPRQLKRVTRRGAPSVSLIVAFLAGLVFFLPFPGWQKLVSFVTSATVLSFAVGPLVWAAMRVQLPDQARPFRLRGGHLIPFLGFLSSNLIVLWAGWDVNWKLFVAVLLGLAVLAVQKLVGRDPLPPMDFKAGSWIMPWMGMLALVSYLGSYGDGSADVLRAGEGAAAMAVVSAIIYAWAAGVRLPEARVRALIAGGVRAEQADPPSPAA